MDIDTISKVLALATDKKYAAITVIVLGYLTSLTSDWSKFPISIPRRWQPVVPLVLGFFLAAATAIAGGKAPAEAFEDAGIVALTTLGAFAVVIKAIYNGNVPPWLAIFAFRTEQEKAMNRPNVPSKSDPPPPNVTASILLLVGLAVLGATTQACSVFTKQNVKTALDVADQVCVVLHADLSNDAVAEACGIDHVLMPAIDALLSAHRAKSAAEHAGQCSPTAATCDGGVCAEAGGR